MRIKCAPHDSIAFRPTLNSNDLRSRFPVRLSVSHTVEAFLLKCCAWFSPDMVVSFKAKQLYFLSHLSTGHCSISAGLCLDAVLNLNHPSTLFSDKEKSLSPGNLYQTNCTFLLIVLSRTLLLYMLSEACWHRDKALSFVCVSLTMILA